MTTPLAVPGLACWLALSGYHEMFLLDAATLDLRAPDRGIARIESGVFAGFQAPRVGAGAPAVRRGLGLETGTTNQLRAWKLGVLCSLGFHGLRMAPGWPLAWADKEMCA